jgi:N-acetyl-anhydromuramyl-L-alanine amidase AmpD
VATSPDHPDLLFIQAEHYARGRPDGPPLWVVVHTMEAGESSTTAESTARYFSDTPDGRQVSSHYCADNNSVVACVKLADTAWTVGNRPGNNRGINWEFAGFARQTPAEWGDEYSTTMLRLAAPYIRADAQRFNIPLRRCSVTDLRAFRPGITSHNDLRLAFGVTTHTDPGASFPWDWFISMLQEDDVTPEEIERAVIRGMSMLMDAAAHRQDSTGRNYANWTYAVQRTADGFPVGDPDLPGTPSLSARLTAIEDKVNQIQAMLLAGGSVEHTHELSGSTGPAVPPGP